MAKIQQQMKKLTKECFRIELPCWAHCGLS